MQKFLHIIWISLLLGSGLSCSQFIDRQPTPDNGPPSAGVEALTRQYPQAQDIVFTTLVDNQLWRATFSQQQLRYQALINPTQLLTADELTDGPLPDSLTRIVTPTALSGGTFSNLRNRRYSNWWSNPVLTGPPVFVYADYTWQQQPFTMYCTISRPTGGKAYYNFYLMSFQQADYETSNPAEIPPAVQTALRQLNMSSTYARVRVDALGKRLYELSVNRPGEYWQLTYSEDGQLLLIWNSQPTSSFILPIREMNQFPPAIQAYLQRPEFTGFSLSQNTYDYSTRHTLGSQSTYYVSMTKGKQYWRLSFSGTGQLINQSLLLVDYF